MKQLVSLFAFTLFTLSALVAQKKPLTLDLHDEWKTMERFDLTPNGEYLVYEIAPLTGDGFVVIQELASLQADTVHRASGYKIDTENNYVAFMISPRHDSLRAMKLREVKEKDLPKDSLGIFVFSEDSVRIIPDVKSFEFSGKGSSYLSYTLEEASKDPEPDGKKKKKKGQKADKPKKTPKDKKGAVVLHNPLTGYSKEIKHATESAFAQEADAFAVVRYVKENWDSAIVDIHANDTILTHGDLGREALKLTWNEQGTRLALLASADTTKQKNHSLYLLQDQEVSVVADSLSTYTYPGFAPSSKGSIYFSQDGDRLYFGIAPLNKEEPKDTLLKDEKAYVDIWHYQDLRIQPEQLKQLKRDKNRTFLTVVHLNENKLVQLADSALENVRVNTKQNDFYGIATNDTPYSIERTWTYPWRNDLYWIDTQTGARTKLLSGKTYGLGISAHGKYAHWYNETDQNWYALRIGTSDTLNLTESLTTQREVFFNAEGEVPAEPYPFGIEGWSKADEHVLIKAEKGIWVIDLTGADAPFELSAGLAKTNDLDLSTYSFEEDFRSFSLDSSIFVTAQNRNTNQSHYFLWSKNGFEELYGCDCKLRMPKKAEESNQFIFRAETFIEDREIYTLPKGALSKASFAKAKKITNTNPQQEDYLWGTVEKYYWKDALGRDSKGLLFEPENFDSTRTYPLMIYFYEKNFDTEHSHRTFRPSYSTVSVPFYTSNDYVVFVPDIRYTTGHPAQDAYNAIVSGAEALAKESWINAEKMAIQGQSWGGYQVAALVTQTNLFAAAMAGAPVSNMTSAYGGIRWGSGLSRMFQYEKTQSRIGGTLWEARDLYLENSPVFHLDNVSTPLLIMHNDEDGAVPWYQGIELYMGMRRLQKPAWMLVYNNEQHNLRKLPNRKDLSRRMFEFFNHYLKEKPMPEWMKEGVPAVNKAENEGYGQ